MLRVPETSFIVSSFQNKQCPGKSYRRKTDGTTSNGRRLREMPSKAEPLGNTIAHLILTSIALLCLGCLLRSFQLCYLRGIIWVAIFESGSWGECWLIYEGLTKLP